MSQGAGSPFAGTERFELRGRLGAGGMGVVYEAYDREREVAVALKTLHRTDDPEALLRFKREFRSLADVSHPNLISLYELIAEGEQWFFTMELLEAIDFVSWVRHEDPPAAQAAGSSTSAPLTAVTTPALETGDAPVERAPRRGGTLDVARLRLGLRGLVAGISALHRSGHLHRDVKPSNVLVTGDGRVVLLDFGVITELSSADRDVHGTPAYMAPEQAAGAAETASDWYAVGAVIYESLTGKRPFEGSSSAIIEAKRHWAPMRPRLETSEVPADLDALCMRLLSREPATRPDGSEIVATLSGQSRRRRRSTGDLGQVVFGRDRELARLSAALDEVRASRAVLVDVYGESGMGKTALIRCFLEQLDGATVLAGRCYENESVPHKAIDSVVDALADHLAGLPETDQRELVPDHAYDLARMFPVLRQVTPIAELADAGFEQRGDDRAEIRRRARDALRQLVAGLAARQPLVMFIDDLHWGDLESAPLIDAITRPPDAPPLLLVTTSRTASRDRSPLLKALRRRRRRLGPALAVREIEVGVLEPEAAAELAARLLPDGAGRHAQTIAGESGGNPYLIGELVRFAGDQRPEAATLDTMIGGRIGRLSEAEARLLSTLSVAGRPLSQKVARRAAAIDRPDWHGLVHQMRQAQLIRVSGFSDDDTVEPYHDRIRETVARGLDDAVRRDRHLQLAESLEADDGGEPYELARHYNAAGDDNRAATWAVIAAELADETLAFDQAASLWQLAIEAGGERPERLEARATALVNAGRGQEAADVYVELAGRLEGLDRLTAMRVAAEQYLRSGYIERGLEVLAEVLGDIGVKLPETARAAVPSFLWYRARLLLRGFRFRKRSAAELPPEKLVKLDVFHTACIGLALIDMGRAAAFAQRHLVYALDAGEPERLSFALAIAAGFNSGSGSPRLTRAMLDLAAELAAEVDEPRTRTFVDLVHSIDLYERGDFAGYEEAAAANERRLRSLCRGVAWELRTTQLLSCTSLFFLGRLDELAEKVPEWMSSATERGDLYATTNVLALAMPIVLLARDEVDEARAALDRAASQWSYQGFTMQRLFCHYTGTFLRLYVGEVEDAYQGIVEGDREVRRSLVLRDRAVGNYWRFMRSSAAAAKAARAESGRGALWRQIRRDARRLDRDDAPCYRAMGAALRAAVCAQRGDRDGAVAELERAVEQFDASGFALYAACARMHLGELIGGDEGAAVAEHGHVEVAARTARPEAIARALICGFG